MIPIRPDFATIHAKSKRISIISRSQIEGIRGYHRFEHWQIDN
ncbi:hypothetical protein [Bythopirellula goksoeyrii]|nr:hypothetical protein [Bythopirellula goksoeyrii]